MKLRSNHSCIPWSLFFCITSSLLINLSGAMAHTDTNVPKDVAEYLLGWCSDNLYAERKYMNEVFKSERDHTTEKLSRISNANNTRFNSIYESINKLVANQSELLAMIKDQELKLNQSINILEEAVASVNLKACTSYLYQENLLFKLKTALYDTLSTIKRNKCCSSELPAQVNDTVIPVVNNKEAMAERSSSFPCSKCGTTFNNSQELCKHVQSVHTASHCYHSEICDKSFNSNSLLDEHMEQVHVETNIIQLDGATEISNTSNPQGISVRTAKYTLNQNKQTSKIINGCQEK